MIFWFQIGLTFTAGWVASKVWTSFLTTGYSIIMIKQAQMSCLILYKEVIEKINSAHELKYNFLSESGINDQSLEVLKRVDEQSVETIKRSMIRTLINTTPKYLSSTIEYKNWDEAMLTLKEPE
jgi:hypothetical protein